MSKNEYSTEKHLKTFIERFRSPPTENIPVTSSIFSSIYSHTSTSTDISKNSYCIDCTSSQSTSFYRSGNAMGIK